MFIIMNTDASMTTATITTTYIAVALLKPEGTVTSTGDEKLPAPTEVTAWICMYGEKERHQDEQGSVHRIKLPQQCTLHQNLQ